MKFRLIMIVAASLSLSACGFGKSAEESAEAKIDEELAALENEASVNQPFSQIPAGLPSIATDPSPQMASIPLSPSVAPITPTPNVTLGSQEQLRSDAGDRIFFQTNASELDFRAQNILRAVAEWMGQNRTRNLTIEGHADERGTRNYNIALGARRANEVKSFLIAQGVPSSRLNAVSFGKERPAADGSNPRSWALNRRAVFIVR